MLVNWLNDPCHKCGSLDSARNLKLIPHHGYIKFVPQIKKVCAGCGRYLRFETQTPELIEKVNVILKEVKL